MAEIRTDPLTGRSVIVAPERARRPRQFSADAGAMPAEPCPFCPGNESATPPESWADRPANSQANQPGWSVRVVPNKYPAVSADTGVHEVIIESAAHVGNLAELDKLQLARIFRAYRQRLRAASVDARWLYRMIFKNQGARAGATFEHAHGQLIALPVIPREVDIEIAAGREFHRRNLNCYYCGLIEQEIQAGGRTVTSEKEFVALCPTAPRFAFETWILPRLHASSFEQADDALIDALASIAGQVIGALDRIQPYPPFNYFIQSPSLADSDRAHYHWQLRLLPQFSRAAGFEWGSGMHTNPVAPEEAARLLRDAAV